MKMIFKKNQSKRTSPRPSGERREFERSFRPFDKVAYAAVLEIELNLVRVSSRKLFSLDGNDMRAPAGRLGKGDLSLSFSWPGEAYSAQLRASSLP
jgi:hypothetical protein